MLLRNFKILLFAIALITLHACKDDKANQIPIEDFFKSAVKRSFKLSPNGKYLSYIQSDKFKTNLYIQSLADGKVSMNKELEKYEVYEHSWTFDNRIILLCGDFRGEKQQDLYLYDVTNSKIKHLLTESKANLRLLNRNRITPEIITLSMNKRDTTYSDVFRMNINTGQLKTYLINSWNVKEWFADIDGKIRLAKVSDGVDETFLYRPDDNSQFKSIIKNNFKNSVKWVAFKPQSNNFYALSNVGRDKSALVEINAITKEERVIYASDKADIQRAEYSRNKRRLEYASWEEAKPKKHFLNPDVERIYNNLLKKLDGNEIAISDRDTAENKFIVSTYTDRNPGSVYLYELKEDKLTKLEDNSNIDPDKLSEMKPVSYKATDGTEITGYLTLPKEGSQTNLPVVVIPHNGHPLGSRNSWGYSAEVQFLANRGYAVLQVNYRGSMGFGKAFYSAGFKELGGKIQQDIADGVNWLISKGIANPGKIAIMGRGFGGFSALYGVSTYPKLYKCAITQDGIINILSYIKDVNQFKPSLERIYEMIGNPENESARLIAISPVFHPEKIKVPLLIFQNDNDQMANISDLNHFVSALQKRKVPVNYRLRKSDFRKFGSVNPRVEMYTEIESFLNAHMGGKK